MVSGTLDRLPATPCGTGLHRAAGGAAGTFMAMPSSRDDDLDWLYGRKKPAADPEPEPTRVLPSDQVPPRQAPPRQQQRPPQQRPPQQQPPRGPQPPPTDRPPRRKRPHRVRNGLLIALAVLLIWFIGVPLYAWSHVDRVAYAPTAERPEDQPGTTYLLVGSDSRSGLSKKEQKEYGTGSNEGQRTDTIMILYVPPGGAPALVSIPRDSFVEIPGEGSNKINAAYAFGGPKLMTRTIEHNTGLRIDEYVEVGFGGFVNVINAIGGVEMCLKEPMKDKDAHINLKAGCQELTGKDALGYVRARKSDVRGDLGRVERQREMIAAMAKKAASPVSIVNPVRYWRLSNAGTDSLAVGEDTSMFAVARMMLAFATISGKDGLTLTVPIANANATTSAGSSVLWDEGKARAMFDDIARGDTSGLKKYKEKK
jgi:LCP family protein required for cell wall assembly